MKHFIALRIFGLAVFILLLMIAVAVVNSIEVIKLGNEVESISQTDMPISGHAADLNECGLRRRIAFYQHQSLLVAQIFLFALSAH